MNLTSRRNRLVPLIITLVALGPVVASAGDKPRKAEKANSNAARMANAAEHKVMMQQQAAQQRQHLAIQHQQLAQQGGIGSPNGVGTGLHHNGTNTGVHPNGVGTGVHHNGIGTNHHRGAETGPMVSSLHSVVGHLHKADHDYDGHRVQAIHQIDQAIHTLQPGTANNRVNGVGGNNIGGTGTANHPHLGTKNGGTSTGQGQLGANGGGARLSQAESDAHLRQAQQELQMLESRISGGAGGVAAHHQQAHTHIQQALQHLNTALATR